MTRDRFKWLLWKLRPLDLRFRRDWVSTYKTFAPSGKCQSLKGAITLASPMMNMFFHWKYKDIHLSLDSEFLRTRHCQIAKNNDSNDEKP